MSDIQDFKALGLSGDMLTALALKGFQTPSQIQALTIPKLLSGDKDLIGQAQTGTDAQGREVPDIVNDTLE